MDKEVLVVFRDDSQNEDIIIKSIVESESEKELSENSADGNTSDLSNEDMINSMIEEETKTQKIEFRKYQHQIYHLAKNRNGIAVLETGTGKTVIAISLIAYHLNKFRLEKKIVFLTETVQLCEQQYRQVKEKIKPLMENIFQAEGKNIDPAKIIFEILHGERDAEISGSRKYKEIIEHSHVFVMTSQVFLNCLRKGYLSILDFSLLVFDECHHSNLGHPYNNIMKEFYFYFKNDKDNKKSLPNILGLTASPLLSLNQNNVCEKTNLENLEENLSLLCQNLDSNYIDYKEKEEDIRMFVNEAKVQLLIFENDVFLEKFGSSFLKYIESFNDKLGKFEEFLSPIPAFANFYSIFKKIYEQDLHLISEKTKALFLKIESYLRVRSIRIIYELGFVAFSYFIADLVEGMDELTEFFEGTKNEIDKEKFFRVKKLFLDLSRVLAKRFEKEIPRESYSIKLEKLISLIKTKTEDSFETTILIFVSKRILARYLSKILSKIFKADFVIGRKKVGDSEGSKVNEVIDSLECQPDDEMLSNHVEQKLSLFQKLNRQKENQNDFIANKFKHILKDKFSLKEQLRAIDNFKNKKIDILICTSVTEEGFDVSMCNLVVAFNDVLTIKSFIQLKGRARKQNSEFILMGPELMEENLQETKRTYEILLKEMKIQISKLSKLKNSEILEKKISLKSKNDQNRYYDCILLKESGALLNSNWSKELVANYCSYFKKSGLKVDRCIEFFLKVDNKGFKCVIILPPSARKRIFFHSNFFQSTDEAKKATYFEAAKKLLEYGCFTKHLKPNNTNIFESDLDSEGPSLQEIDPKNVKRVQKSKNGKILSNLVYYRKHNEIWDLTLYKKEFNFIPSMNYLYSIEFFFVEKEEKIESEVRLGFIYFTDWLHDYRADFKFAGKNAFLTFKVIKAIDEIPLEILDEAIQLSYFIEASFRKDFLFSKFKEDKLFNLQNDKACFVPLNKKNEIDFEKIRNFMNLLKKKKNQILDKKQLNYLNDHRYLTLLNDDDRIFILEKSQKSFIIRDISEKLPLEKKENLDSEARIPNFEQEKLNILPFPFEFFLHFLIVLKNIQKIKEHISSKLFQMRLIQKEKGYNQKSFPIKILKFDFSFFNNEFLKIMKNPELETLLKKQASCFSSFDAMSKDLSEISLIQPIENIHFAAINSLNLEKSYKDSDFLETFKIETIANIIHLDDSIKAFYGGIGQTLINFLVRLKLFQEFFEADYSRLYAELKRLINDRYKGLKVCQHYLYEYMFNSRSNRNFFLFDYRRSNGEWKAKAKYEKIPNKNISQILDRIIGGIYLECIDDAFACDKFLGMLNYYDGPCLQNIRFHYSHENENLKHYYSHLEQIKLPFKNKYLLLNALIHNSFISTIYNFYKNENFSEILSSIDFISNQRQEKRPKDINESSLSLLECFSNKFNDLDTSSLHNERLVFLGEGYLDYLIQKILLKIFTDDIDKFLMSKKVFTSRCFYLFICLRFKLDELLLCSPGIRFNCKDFKEHLDYFSKNFSQFINKVFFKMSKTPDYSILSDLFPAVAAAFLIDSDLNLKEADEQITDYFQLESIITTILQKLNLTGTPWNKYQKFLKDYNLKEPQYKLCKTDYELKEKGQCIYKFQFRKKNKQAQEENNCIEVQADTEENAKEELIRQLFSD